MGTPSFSADTKFGAGKSIDLSDGHVEIATGGDEEIFDGGDKFSVSAWVKGWPADHYGSVVSKGGGTPILGWKASHLTGDSDSGISSDYTYTTAINVNGSDKTINGVTFTGASGDSGNGWIRTEGFSGTHASENSTVTGQMGAMLSNGFRYTGATQRIKMTGLTNGKSYVFSLYSQAWGSGGGDRTCTLSSSDFSGSFTINQNQYYSSSQDGLLVECTYIANGTEAEFTIIPSNSNNSWHLYAFSNREATNGWSIEKGASSANDLTVNLSTNGGHQTASHSTPLSSGNNWHHIVSTYDGTNRKIYLDGSQVSSAVTSGTSATTTAALILGGADLSSTQDIIEVARHSGIKLDEVRFYKNGLSADQVSALYNNGYGDIGNVGDFTGLPAKISGTKGTAITPVTISAAFSNAYFEAINLPPGLSINNTSGEITGTPTVGGVGSITIIAKNADGKRAVTTIPYDSEISGPLLNFPSLTPASDHAVILGEITHSGGGENTVDLIWGTNATLVGTQFSDLGALNPSTTYNYQNFTPSSPSIALWLDADDNTTLTVDSSNKISKWADKSTNDNNATQSTSSKQPTLTANGLNGKPYVTFDGSNDSLAATGLNISQSYSFFIAAKRDSGSSTKQYLFDGIGSNRSLLSLNKDGRVQMCAGDWTNSTFNTPTGSFVISAIFDSSSSRLALNGTNQSSLSTGSTNLTNGIRIGGNYDDATDYLKGSIAEFLILDETASSQTQSKIEGYLAHKWGLSSNLPSSHTYASNPPKMWSSTSSSSQVAGANAYNLGSGKEGFYGTTISGLESGETYYYRLRSQGKLNPKGISGSNLKLWLDASELTSLTGKWEDKSGNGNSADVSGNPSVVTNAQNGLSVMHYTGNSQYHDFVKISDIRTVFWVVSQDSSANGSGYRFLLCAGGYGGSHPGANFHNDANGKFWGNGAHSHVKTNSTTKMNGTQLSGHTDYPNNLSIISLVTAGNVAANRFGQDRTHTGRQWIGKLGELIIYNSALTPTEVEKVEGYLAHKWALTNNLDNAHSYKTAIPTSQVTWSDVQSFTTPTNVSAPVLGGLSTSNLTTTTGDLDVALNSNGNAATDVIFYWGTTDGGNNPSSWDSNFTVSNAQTGTVRNSLTGLTEGSTYYFRAYASNWKGNVWSGNTLSFSTITSSVRENPIRHTDLTGWWKLDGNLKDSSGNNRHGRGDFTLSPKNFGGLKLWLDASELATSQSYWSDKSGNNNSATKNGTPTVSTNAQNGHSLMYYNGGGDYHTFSNIADIRTIFWVVSRDAGISNSYRHLLSGASTAHFHGSNNGKFWTGQAHAHVKNGYTKMNGTQLYYDTNHPTTLSIISLRTTGNVEADRFGVDRNYGSLNRYWIGNLGELIIYNTALTNSEIEKVEGYLAHKWGLDGSLDSGHPYKSVVPLPESNPFITDVATGSGTALDLSNGVFATVSTGGSEDVFDGDNNFSLSMWVKGWPQGANQHLLSKNDISSPSEISDLKLWLDASDDTTISHSSNAVNQWSDKSGNGNHAFQSTSANQPTITSSGIQFDGSNDGFNLTNDISEANLNIFFVLQGYGYLFSNDGSERTLFHEGGSGRKLWVRINHNEFFSNQAVSGYSDSSTQIHEFSLNSGTFTVRVNGVQALSQASVSGNMKIDRIGLRWDSSTSVPRWTGKLMEILAVSTTTNRAEIESYLARKWGLTGQLPSGHANSNGWSIGRGSSGSDNLTLDLPGAGGAFTQQVPMDDDSWHHLSTTFGGGNKKIYVDGVQVATASQTGSVTDSIFQLFWVIQTQAG